MQREAFSLLREALKKTSNMQLKTGSSGEQVKKLQQLLGISADGIFGKATEAALRKWQSANGLSSDGIAGEETLSRMGISGPVIVAEQPSQIDLSVLENVLPAAVYVQLSMVRDVFNGSTMLRMCHFLSQCAHESRDFKLVTENLNYSADGLIRTFSKYFPGNLNESYAWKPEKIGSRVYANRMGNGTEQSGEGYKYRGRGYIQLTGKNNYKEFSKFVGEDVVVNPDLVATKYPLVSAGYFFDSNGIWRVCDLGSTRDVIEAVTKRINGGLKGIEDRVAKFAKYQRILL